MKGFKSLRSSLGSRFSKKAGDDGKVRGGEGVSAAGGATSGKENDSGEILDGNGGGGGGGGAERRGPYVFGCFDVNGKCGLPQWRRRKEELQSLDDEALQEEALELLGGGAPPPGAGEGRDGLTSALMAMEELGEVTFDTSPRLTELRGALKEAVGGGESNFDFSYHVPAAYPAKEGEERYVRDDAALKECLATVRESGMLPLAIELHPRSCLVHLDCFDAEADEDDVYLARITVPDDAPWEDLEGALRHEFRGGMRDGCLVYWVRQGRRGFPNGSVAFVDAEGRGWEELRSACLRDAGRRAEVDIKFSPNVTKWSLTDLSSAALELREIEWENPLPRAETFRLASDSDGRVQFAEEEVSLYPSPDCAQLTVSFVPPGRGGLMREVATLSLVPKGGGAPSLIRVRAEWV